MLGEVLWGIASMVWWLLPLAVLAGVLQSAWFKGRRGEALVRRTLAQALPPPSYSALHDVLLPTAQGTTQIDHVVISVYGVLVVETKHMRGWIFGGAQQAQWTQSFPRRKFKFQNPLRQNYRHVKALEAALGVPAVALHSVVVFTGDCTLKTSMPPQVHTLGTLPAYVQGLRTPVLTREQVAQACARLEALRLPSNWRTRRAHVQQLRARHAGVDGRKG